MFCGSFSTFTLCTGDKRRLWRDCAYAPDSYVFLLFTDAIKTKILWAGLYNFERASVPQANFRFAIGPFIHQLYIYIFEAIL